MVRVLLLGLVLSATATVSAASEPATQPVREFSNIADALTQVPDGVIPSAPDGWNDAKVDAANEALERTVAGQHITLRVKFESAQRDNSDNKLTVYRLTGTSEEETPSAKIYQYVEFDKASLLDLAKLKEGDLVTVSGDARLYFDDNNGPTRLVVQVTAAKVVKVTREGTTPTTAPADRDAPTTPAQR